MTYRNEKETRDAMIPICASSSPMCFSSLARKASVSRMETKYSNAHWAV